MGFMSEPNEAEDRAVLDAELLRLRKELIFFQTTQKGELKRQKDEVAKACISLMSYLYGSMNPGELPAQYRTAQRILTEQGYL